MEEPVASLTDATTASGISSGSAGPAWEYMETALAKRKRCLPLLGELSAAAGDTLDDLYSRLHDLLIQIPGPLLFYYSLQNSYYDGNQILSTLYLLVN